MDTTLQALLTKGELLEFIKTIEISGTTSTLLAVGHVDDMIAYYMAVSFKMGALER